MQRPVDDRASFLGSADYSQAVKDAAGRLVQAFETKSTLLNDNLLTDIAQIDSNFFDPARLEAESKVENGEWVGRFQVENEIGKGGMSIVYRAKQCDPIKRNVALKMLRSSLLAPRSVMRFLREQQALALVSHPNIATLYEVGSTESGVPFAAMELVNGVQITDFCNDNQLAEDQRLQLFLKVGDALSHAHKHGVIHRDAKPGNILVETGEGVGTPKLIDFGIAKIFSDEFRSDPTMTQLGQILGSPRYMSPEQLEGKSIDHRSDIYSSALVLFELLARRPYRDMDSTEEMIASIKADNVCRLSHRMKSSICDGAITDSADIRKFIRFAAKDLDWIVVKALEHDPDNRYQTMESFVDDIRASMDGEPINAPKPGLVRRIKTGLNSSRTKAALLAFAAIVAVALTFGVSEWMEQASELAMARQASVEARKVQTDLNLKSAATNELILELLAKTPESSFKLDDSRLIPMYENQVKQIEESGGPKSEEHTAVYGILAVCYAMGGEFEKSAEIIANVDDQEKAAELKLVREQICFRYEKEASENIKQLREHHQAPARARQMLLLGRCFYARDNLVEAKKILKEAIAYFDQEEVDTFCADSLFARHALMDVLEAMGQTNERTKVLAHTKLIFINARRADSTILSTPREKEIFDRIMKETTSGPRPLFDHLR